jgi:1-phosphofructokinase
MSSRGKIVTVGLCPCWDTVLRLNGIDWGQHKLVDSMSLLPAGKALNISRALAWMGDRNTAAGLWGRDDYGQMLKAMRPLRSLVNIMMTAVRGSTRRNTTVVDLANGREMHIRSRSELASKEALRKLRADLKEVTGKNTTCVFAGLMPQSDLVGDVVRCIRFCSDSGAKVVLDTSGEALKEIVDTGTVWLVKPNVAELRGLLGEQVADNPASLAKAACRLLEKVEGVLVSRGPRGSVAVTKQGAWWSRCRGRRKVLSTVGCGDYLLAGFLKGIKDTSDAGSALRTATKVATARAWGWTENKSWAQVQQEVEPEVGEI